MGEYFFPLQVVLTGTTIQVTHFDPTMSPSQKQRDIERLYGELLAPTGIEQGSENIRVQEIDTAEGREDDQIPQLFATQFLEYAKQVGAQAMCLLMHDRKSLIFISTDPAATSQHREDMLSALRKTYPTLHHAKSTKKTDSLLAASLSPKKDLSPSLPFFVRFQAWYHEMALLRFDDLIQRASLSDPVSSHTDVAALIESLEDRVLTRSKKYLMTESAFLMHKDVHQPMREEWIEPSENRWMEFYEPKDTRYGKHVRGVHLSRGYPSVEIALVLETERGALLEKLYRPHMSRWHLLILADPPVIVYDFIYDKNEKRFCFSDQWRCPTQTCIPIKHDETDLLAEAFASCASCQQAMRFWSAWLFTTMRMIRGDYALRPEPPSFEDRTISYEEEMMQTVGKGKNRRRINGKKQRDLLYTVISYDVSVQKPETQKEAPADEKRLNWLMTTPKELIIYERRHIEPFERHYIKQAGTYTVTPHEGHHRYVPLLKRVPKNETVVKITARKYEDSSSCQ